MDHLKHIFPMNYLTVFFFILAIIQLYFKSSVALQRYIHCSSTYKECPLPLSCASSAPRSRARCKGIPRWLREVD